MITLRSYLVFLGFPEKDSLFHTTKRLEDCVCRFPLYYRHSLRNYLSSYRLLLFLSSLTFPVSSHLSRISVSTSALIPLCRPMFAGHFSCRRAQTLGSNPFRLSSSLFQPSASDESPGRCLDDCWLLILNVKGHHIIYYLLFKSWYFLPCFSCLIIYYYDPAWI